MLQTILTRDLKGVRINRDIVSKKTAALAKR